MAVDQITRPWAIRLGQTCCALIVAGLAVDSHISAADARSGRLPSFAGTWLLEGEPGKQVSLSEAIARLEIEQSGSTLVIRKFTRGRLTVRRYDLTGKPSKNVDSEADEVLVFTSRWSHRQLVTTVSSQKGRATVTNTLSLDSGGSLVIQNEAGGGSSGRAVFRRMR